jgi:hypothetical protein
MTDPESEWRVWAGTGLLAHTPMSDERRAAFKREAERERQQTEFEAQQIRERAIERRWDLQRQGYAPRSVGDVLAAGVAGDGSQRPG